MPGSETTKHGFIYCLTDKEGGANPFGHINIFLLYKDWNKEWRVSGCYAFYPMPQTRSHDMVNTAKKKMGLDYDLWGNHGYFKMEELRYYDTGCPLYGEFFSLEDEEDYNRLSQTCQTIIKNQNEAIDEHAESLKLVPKPSDKTRHYCFEHKSMEINEAEQKLAEQEGRPSRLIPYTLTLHNTRSNNCKVFILKLLEGFLPPAEIDRLAGWHRAIPILSGKLPRVFFHSVGPLHDHIKRSGEVVHYRKHKDASLLLTACTQKKDVIDVIGRLQQLEWLLININAGVADMAWHVLCENLVSHIREHYKCFAKAWPLESQVEKDSMLRFFTPVDDQNIKNAKSLLDTFYFAVTGEYDKEAIDKRDPHDLPFILVPKLPLDTKKKICEILGKTFVDLSVENEKRAAVGKIKTM